MGIFKRKNSLVKEQSKAIPFVQECWHYRRFNGELLDIDTIVACIDALARNLAKMELTAIRRNEDAIAVTNLTSDVAKVLKRPNQYQSQYEFLYKITAMFFASNNAYIWPEYDKQGILINLWPINYRNAKIYEKDGVEVIRFELKKNHFFTVPYSQIIHLRNHYIRDELYGDSNDAFAPIAELMDAQKQGIKGGIKNSALIRGILKATQVMKEDDIRKAREEFIRENFQVQNNGGVMALDGKFDYTSIESKPYIVDADTMKTTEEAAFTYFGVNRDFLQNKFDSAGYEAVYEGRLEPTAIYFCEKLTIGLFTDRERSFGNEIIGNMHKLKYQPLSQVTQLLSATKELGLYTVDEAREMLGMEPLGPENGGDRLMIATNNYTALDPAQEPDQEGESDE